MGIAVASIILMAIVGVSSDHQAVESMKLAQEMEDANTITFQAEKVWYQPAAIEVEETPYHCFEPVQGRPMECVSETERCILIDGALRYCKPLQRL